MQKTTMNDNEARLAEIKARLAEIKARLAEVADALERDLPGLRSLTSNSGAEAMMVSGSLVPKLEAAIALMRGLTDESR